MLQVELAGVRNEMSRLGLTPVLAGPSDAATPMAITYVERPTNEDAEDADDAEGAEGAEDVAEEEANGGDTDARHYGDEEAAGEDSDNGVGNGGCISDNGTGANGGDSSDDDD